MAQSIKLAREIKMNANFTGRPIELGSIYKRDDGDLILERSFAELLPDLNLNKFVKHGKPADLKVHSQTSVGISISGDAKNPIGKSELGLHFKQGKSTVAGLKDVVVSEFGLGNVREELMKVWARSGYDKFRDRYVIIPMIYTADSGTVIYSEEGNNKIILKHTLGEPLTGLADIGSGKVSIETNSKRTLEVIRPTAFVPFFRMMKLRANGEFETVF